MTRSHTTRASSGTTPSRRFASSTSSSGESRGPARYAPRPYEIVVLSDHGQTQGATFKQRNGYGARRAGSPLDRGAAGASASRRRRERGGGRARARRGARRRCGESTTTAARRALDDKAVVVLGSGNLGLVYLMEERRRLTLEEIEGRHPRLVPTLREHPHVGFVLANSADHGPVALGARGAHYLRDNRVEGDDPLRAFSANARSAPRAFQRLRARSGPVRQQLLRRASRRGVRLRGADLVPRRHGRIADAPVHPRARRPAATGASRSWARRACTTSCGLESAPEPRAVGSLEVGAGC